MFDSIIKTRFVYISLLKSFHVFLTSVLVLSWYWLVNLPKLSSWCNG